MTMLSREKKKLYLSQSNARVKPLFPRWIVTMWVKRWMMYAKLEKKKGKKSFKLSRFANNYLACRET